ncbi:hypothetical protein OQJ18_04445 [Fluoribacter dumoffii]|uniref:Uncharacterized protein n=1 Tax=Fluoribacter dumoffii TaxID=463 RepID=A0A377GAT3_9GAMM|nr:hypothetical protein [Fluoribacter dumoffii]KTC90318.1 hypothetical protein Ldum_1386 [Fluoribacter dumoffii NY 23]MCW8385635.1 hypothetical protein [Fluoribacter dumoffii]MCW8418664.1 hypothetical protein [Fluoribacter dumoffii]MCW8453492.1 hypothetical protein [Fluoribacter dumoffii]MCW8459288.1 hypothetical protein [Fluoribacter dumoffii]
MYTKKEVEQKSTTEYQIGVCIKDTNQENGPGHVTTLLIKKKEGKTTQIRTTSFYPGPVGSLVNGVTFGSVPVSGQLAPDHLEDVKEADHVLVKSLPKEQFKNAKQGQTEFNEDVKKGHRLYSVFGKENPLAKGMKRLVQGAGGAHMVVEKHKKETGCYPPEDFCGIHVFDDDHPTPPKVRIDNCSSSATHILRRGGIDFENPLIPTFFTSELQKHGFNKVDKDTFVKEHCNSSKKL